MISVCGQIGIPREIQPVQSGDDNPSHESTLGIKPGPHWCEARTLTTEPVGRLRYQVYMKIKPSKSLTDLVLYTVQLFMLQKNRNREEFGPTHPRFVPDLEFVPLRNHKCEHQDCDQPGGNLLLVPTRASEGAKTGREDLGLSTLICFILSAIEWVVFMFSFTAMSFTFFSKTVKSKSICIYTADLHILYPKYHNLSYLKTSLLSCRRFAPF